MTRLRRLIPFVVISTAIVPTASAQDYEAALKQVASGISTCLHEAQAKKAAVVDFVDLEGRTSQFGRLVAEEFSVELVRQSRVNGFTMIDRAHTQQILREAKLSAEGLVDPANSRKLGQISGVDTLITGTVVRGESTYRVMVKTLDAGTATINCSGRGEFPKSMLSQEFDALPVESGSARTLAPAVSASSETAPPTVTAGPLLVKLVSIDKTRDGNQVQLVLSVRNTLKDSLDMALIPEELPVLLDNSGAPWTLKRQSGVNVDSPNGQIHVWTTFSPGVDALLSFLFAGSASAGTSFTFTGAFISRVENKPYDPYHPPRIPVGLAGMRLR